jgi:hypothetical protein
MQLIGNSVLGCFFEIPRQLCHLTPSAWHQQYFSEVNNQEDLSQVAVRDIADNDGAASFRSVAVT